VKEKTFSTNREARRNAALQQLQKPIFQHTGKEAEKPYFTNQEKTTF
jgi:hypothetical protein